MSAIIPQPRCAITIRPGTIDDLPFIDALQKMHTKQVGWMPTKTLEGKIKAGHVLIAEEPEARSQEPGGSASTGSWLLAPGSRVGYLIGNDQYFKRDDVGIVYQLNVVPGKQRGLIGASLLKAQFERSAYGCKLYCCWCAQDIAANRFWESGGIRAAGVSRRQREEVARAHLLAEANSSGRYDDGVVVSIADDGWVDSGGSIGVADPAGDALE